MVSGKKIRACRVAAGLTICQLAKKVYVSQPTITQYEIGVKQPSAATLKRLSDALGVTMEELMEKDSA